MNKAEFKPHKVSECGKDFKLNSYGLAGKNLIYKQVCCITMTHNETS